MAWPKSLLLFLSLSWASPACTNDFHFHLRLQPDRDTVEAFELQLDQLSGGIMHYRLSGPDGPEVEGQWPVEEGEAIQRDLERVGVWELQDGDSGEGEIRVYYTLCEVERGDSHRLSHWRGLPQAHAQVAGYFLCTRAFQQWTQQALSWCAAHKKP